MFCSNLYPCASRQILVHNIRLEASSAPTKSDSVLLFLFSFYFCDMDTISPLTIFNVAPVFYLKSKCTVNSASTYHFRNCFCLPLMQDIIAGFLLDIS